MSSFKKALKTTLLFILILTLLSTSIMALYAESENDYFQNTTERDELAGTIDYMVIGASHALRGLKCDVLDEKLGVNSYNLSMPSMSMMGRYMRLKDELERNPVKQVVIEVSYDTIRRSRAKEAGTGSLYLIANNHGIKDRLRYLKTLPIDRYPDAYFYFINNGIDCIKKIAAGQFHMTNHYVTVYKGYAAYETPCEDVSHVNIAKITNKKHPSETENAENIEYLNKMVSLCRERGIEPVLVCVPMSNTAVRRYANLDYFREWYENYAAENGLKFYDFNLLKSRNEFLSDVDCFRDEEHMGVTGAHAFTTYFADFMLKEEAGEDQTDLFYASYKQYKTILKKHYLGNGYGKGTNKK